MVIDSHHPAIPDRASIGVVVMILPVCDSFSRACFCMPSTVVWIKWIHETRMLNDPKQAT
jgi:hypothetical protein